MGLREGDNLVSTLISSLLTRLYFVRKLYIFTSKCPS
ncbi:hypothetical protein TIFTF001_001774 [Ficus carica]|uniref:Uncharacterized protein n=1 Tax=Ficus carica TaxID=3494 RepID=A0AA87Z812_FICCA|nr:hypothetical protein TIFTF001_001774 [Ficus carica]